MNKKPITLCIMDGYGYAPRSPGNAITSAATPNLDKFTSQYPHSSLTASGLDVGLPEGQMGNSEVGHTNIGAGRVVFQDLPRISNAILSGEFYENPALSGAVESCVKNGTALHLLGLMSDGGVHSHNTHVWALLELARRHGLKKVYLHCFLDGRDVTPKSGADFVAEAVAKCAELTGCVATVTGRYYAMDRDNRWERVVRAYSALVYSEGRTNADPVDAIRKSYDEGVTDEFVEPVICNPDSAIRAGDSVIFFNFRPDRAREITRAFVDPEFDGFERKNGMIPVNYVCMTQYDASMPNVSVAFKPQSLENTMGEYLSRLGLRQLRIAETEKYAHVTFFFNGGVEKVYPGEDRVLVPSPKVAIYDLQPEMSAYTVTDSVVERIDGGEYDLVVLNFANCDMVGHTGVFDAARRSVEVVDECVGRVVDATLAAGGLTVITADHGNAERMIDDDGVSPYTAHTTNPVPFIVCGAGEITLESGRLCDLMPTILALMELDQPPEMTGKSLIMK